LIKWKEANWAQPTTTVWPGTVQPGPLSYFALSARATCLSRRTDRADRRHCSDQCPPRAPHGLIPTRARASKDIFPAASPYRSPPLPSPYPCFAVTVHRQAAAPQAPLGQPPSCATATPLSGTSPQAALCQGKHLKNSNAKPPREPFAWTARTRPPSTPPAPPRPSPEWHAPPRPLR
jgi:hypothetical protein